MASIGWRLIKRLAQQLPGVEVRLVDRMVTMPNGGTVQVKSADNPDHLRGEGLDLVVLDECAFVKESAWSEALRPALSDRQGRAIFISTPKGRNWFWRLWQRGTDEGDLEWQAWRFPTADNPFIPETEIEAARLGLPERIFQQEYLAEFIEDAGGIFRKVMAAATSEPGDWDVAHSFVIGVDWAKHQDYTVISVLNATLRRQVYLDRMSQIDYTLQVDRLRALCEKYRPDLVVAERNAMGEPLIEQLQRQGLPVQPFTTTNASKAQAIDALALAFERGDLQILPDPVQIGELQGYEAQRLPSGMLRYSAPEGMHDDTVIALALAWHGIVGGRRAIEVGPSPVWDWRG